MPPATAISIVQATEEVAAGGSTRILSITRVDEELTPRSTCSPTKVLEGVHDQVERVRSSQFGKWK